MQPQDLALQTAEILGRRSLAVIADRDIQEAIVAERDLAAVVEVVLLRNREQDLLRAELRHIADHRDP